MLNRSEDGHDQHELVRARARVRVRVRVRDKFRLKVITQHNLGQYADDHAHGLRGVHLALEAREEGSAQLDARCTMHVLRARTRGAHATTRHACHTHAHAMHMPCT